MTDGTPLPAALSGEIFERVIRLDSTLFYLVNGALQFLLDREPLVQTGTLTPEIARDALSAMFYTYLWGEAVSMPVGAITMWWADTPPENWLLLNGDALDKNDYPGLFDIFGYAYGGGGDIFILPTMAGYSPYGAGADVDLGDSGGADTHTLSTAELPSHNHAVTDPGHNHAQQIGTLPQYTPTGGSGRTAAGVLGTNSLVRVVTDNNTTGITTQNTGSASPFSILHPVKGVNFIIYAGAP